MKAKRTSHQANWDDLRILLTVARQGSFLAAARELNVVTSTVARRIGAMESKAQTALVERRTDGVHLTQAGQALVELAGKVEVDIATAFRDATPAADRLQGAIRISISDGFSEVMTLALLGFTQRNPEVRFELIVEARIANIAKREADLAIRMVNRQEDTLIYRRAGELSFGVWASPKYIERTTVPIMEADLSAHQFISTPFNRMLTQWLESIGARQLILVTNSFSTQLAAVRAGVGIAALPRISAAGLVEVLPSSAGPTVPVYLVTNRVALRKPHIRAFADYLFEQMQTRLALPTR